MQTSRDSSIWRSLAVAFGDGLAFGVGMTLTQTAAKKTASAPTDLRPIADRLAEIEGRVARVETAPTPISSPQSPSLDQSVLEAVVNALEARLNEHAGQVERRLAELEGKVSLELRSVHEAMHSLASGAESRISEVQSHVNEQILAVRRFAEEDLGSLQKQTTSLYQELTGAVGRQVEEQVALQIDLRLPELELGMEGRLAETLRAEIDTRVPPVVDARLDSVEARVKQEVRLAAAQAAGPIVQAAERAIDERLAPLRAELQEKARTVVEMRERAAETDRNVLDALMAIGRMCRDTAERIVTGETDAPGGGPPPAVRTPEPPPPPAAEVEVAAAPEAPEDRSPDGEPAQAAEEAKASADLAEVDAPIAMVVDSLPLEDSAAPAETADPPPIPHALEPGTEVHLHLAPDPEDSIPGFAQPRKAGRLWRIPLVSSLLMTSAALLALRYVH